MRGTGFVLVLWWMLATTSFSANVSYDHRALVIDGKRRVLMSGSIHYPRSTPEVLLLETSFFGSCVCVCVSTKLLFNVVGRCGRTWYKNLKMEDWM
jgi:hypothetical protein